MQITYAKAGGPPANWNRLAVFDADTGEEITHIIEVDSAAGWLERITLIDGKPVVYGNNSFQTEKVYGRFTIQEKQD